MTFHIFTFGCQMNVSDSDWLRRALIAQGMRETDPEHAKVLIINTCSVRDKPEQKVYSLLGRLKKLYHKDKEIFAAVGGCVAQQIGKHFWARFPFVRLVFGTDGLTMAPQAIERLLQKPGMRMSLLDFSEEYEERPLYADNKQVAQGQAFVTIMQGCDNFCTYCIVPYVRGRQKSRPAQAIIAECQELVNKGVREIMLLGQNVNSFGQDKHAKRVDGTSFSQLLRQVAAIPGLDRLRFTTSHPKDLADDVIAAFGELPNLCPRLHLPMQSGSDSVLKAMGRKYTMARYMDIIKRLRQARPDISFTTDIIVGFPGESEEDFQMTMRAVEEIGFESSFSFMYSDRPGVRAEKMEPKVDLEIKAERLSRLQELQNNLAAKALANTVGTKAEVFMEAQSKMLILPGEEEPTECFSMRGRDAHGRVVNLVWPESTDAKPLAANELIGKMITADIMAAKKHSLFGKTIGEPW